MVKRSSASPHSYISWHRWTSNSSSRVPPNHTISQIPGFARGRSLSHSRIKNLSSAQRMDNGLRSQDYTQEGETLCILGVGRAYVLAKYTLSASTNRRIYCSAIQLQGTEILCPRRIYAIQVSPRNISGFHYTNLPRLLVARHATNPHFPPHATSHDMQQHPRPLSTISLAMQRKRVLN